MLVEIKRVEKRQGKRSAYMLVELGDGRQVYCWSESVFPVLRPGRRLDLEIADGKFPKIVGVRSPNGGLAEQGPAYRTGPDRGSCQTGPGPDRVRLAARSAALQAAVELAKVQGGKVELERLLKWSEVLFDWLTS